MSDVERRHNEKCIPIRWSGWDQLDTFHIQWIGVEFMEDFGPISKGTFYDAVDFNLETCKLTAWTEDKQVLTMDLVLVPLSRERGGS